MWILFGLGLSLIQGCASHQHRQPSLPTDNIPSHHQMIWDASIPGKVSSQQRLLFKTREVSAFPHAYPGLMVLETAIRIFYRNKGNAYT